MRLFIKNLLSDSNEISHKRVIAIGAFIILIGMFITNQFGIKTDNTLILMFGGIAGGESVLTVLDKFTIK